MLKLLLNLFNKQPRYVWLSISSVPGRNDTITYKDNLDGTIYTKDLGQCCISKQDADWFIRQLSYKVKN